MGRGLLGPRPGPAPDHGRLRATCGGLIERRPESAPRQLVREPKLGRGLLHFELTEAPSPSQWQQRRSDLRFPPSTPSAAIGRRFG